MAVKTAKQLRQELIDERIARKAEITKERSNLLYGTLVWKLANNHYYVGILTSLEKMDFTKKEIDTAIDIITNYAGKWKQ